MSNSYGNLEVSVRTPDGKGGVRRLRREGKFPAVIYGHGGEAVAIAIDPLAYGRATDPKMGFNTYFQLSLVEAGKPARVERCMIADLQRDPLTNRVIHIDFMRVDPEREVVRSVPVRVTGRAAGAVKGGRVDVTRRNVHVAAKPASMPFEIVLDVTPLDNGESIKMKDVKLPDARLDEPPELTLALCHLARAKTEDEAPAAGGKPAAPAAGGKAAPAAAAKAPAAKAPAKK